MDYQAVAVAAEVVARVSAVAPVTLQQPRLVKVITAVLMNQ
jgi:hypothetical protein